MHCRFWYQNPGIFEPEQVSELEKSSLSRVLCDNGDDINIIQADAFRYAELSEMGPCEALPEVRLDVWDDIRRHGYCTCNNIDSKSHSTPLDFTGSVESQNGAPINCWYRQLKVSYMAGI
jgi:hypothetical protein